MAKRVRREYIWFWPIIKKVMEKKVMIKFYILVIKLVIVGNAFSQSTDGHFPFKKVPLSQLKQSEKKVFAHYFTPYPLSFDNKQHSVDYYSLQYNNPEGENFKFFERGGFFRQRPLPRAPLLVNDKSYKLADYYTEIRKAAAIGIDGFTLDILDYNGGHWEKSLLLFKAARKLNDFKIIIMPDMNSYFKKHPEDFVPAMVTLSKEPSAYRYDDGRLLISPYLAENFSPQWWVEKLDQLSEKGIDVAFLPLYQGWGAELERFKKEEPLGFKKYIIGVSDWGSRTPKSARNLLDQARNVHEKYKIKWMGPVAPQDIRPKSKIYTEAGNSETFREMWSSAIKGNADYVQIITWNDYSEASEISPSTQTGFSFYDLAAYYIQWYKTGNPPDILHDAIFTFYREHSTSASLTGDVQTVPMRVVNGQEPLDKIEMLAFVSKPSTLEINDGKKVHKSFIGKAGLKSFSIPLQEGRPVFTIKRNHEEVVSLIGRWAIKNSSLDIQDLMYRGTNSLRVNPFVSKTNYRELSPARLENFEGKNSIRPYDFSSKFTRVSNYQPEVLRFWPGNQSGGVFYDFLPLGNNKFVKIEFDLRLNSYCLMNSDLDFVAKDKNGVTGIKIRLCNQNHSALINSPDAKDSKTLNSMTLKKYEWNKVTVVVFPSTSGKFVKFDLWLTDSNGTRKLAGGLGFENEVNNLASFGFNLVNTKKNYVDLFIDNIRLKK